MSSLDDLLKDAMAHKASADALKASKTKLRDSRLGERERNEVADMVRALESQHDYTPVALVFRRNWYICNHCGCQSHGGGQVLQQEKHLRIAGTQRFVAVKMPYRMDLPRKVDNTKVELDICGECMHERGFGVAL